MRGCSCSVVVLPEIVDGVECPVKCQRLRRELARERLRLRSLTSTVSLLAAEPAVAVVRKERVLTKEGCLLGWLDSVLVLLLDILVRCSLPSVLFLLR